MPTRSTIRRSLIKTITYRVAIVVTNGAVIYAITGRWDETIGFTSAAGILNTILYFANERLWNRINLGRQSVPHESTLQHVSHSR